MPIPTARVKIEILRILAIPSVTLAAGHTRYARAVLQAGTAPRLSTGRSRPIPAAGGTFNLAPEAAPWSFEVSLDPLTDIQLTIRLMEDHGDGAPPAAVTISGTVPDPWTSGTQTFGSGPRMEVRVTTTMINPTEAAFLARAAVASGVSGTIAVPEGFLVQFVTIAGLYQPTGTITTGTPGSTAVPGYRSEDNLGRIFTNRLSNGNWARDTQFIDVQVRVTAFGAVTLPGSVGIAWTIVDADDPTNDEPEFHRDWGRYVDANDYDAAGTPLGAHGDDNAGAFSSGNSNENLLFGAAASGSPTARWAAVPGGGSAPSGSSRTQAQSTPTIINATTATASVRVHCPNVLGTNLILKAELTGTPAGIPVHNATTGVMTMWSRIQVDVARMAHAHSVAGVLPSIPDFFLPVCVQLDFENERPVTGALDKANMGATEALLDTSVRAWVNNSTVFPHRTTPGWFFLGAARFPNPLPPGGTPAPLFDGTTYTLGTSGTDVWVEVAVSAATADFLQFEWTDPISHAARVASFSVRGTPTVTSGVTRILMFGNDVTPGFTGHDADGSISHAMNSMILFFPRHEWPAGATALVAGGFGVPTSGARLRVFPAGATFTTGISPDIPNSTGTDGFFAGRTVLFTHTPSFSHGSPPAPNADFDQEVLGTVVHEFLHAFGMPHKCGQWNWRTPRDTTPDISSPKQTCCMNYFNTWLLDASNHLLPGFIDRQGNDMCGRHLMEVRRVHLERNLGLHW